MRAPADFEIEPELSREFKDDLDHAVRVELDVMLAAPIFAQSARCKKFLTYVVLETLSGNSSHLKERTVGINVFQRANDYDTGDDSIVRVTANEVRKRIGQFYLESTQRHSVHIELPRGGYVPEFKLNPPTEAWAHEEHSAADHQENIFHSAVQLTGEREPRVAIEEHPIMSSGATVTSSRGYDVVTHGKSRRFRLGLVAIACIVGIGGWTMWKSQMRSKAPDVWGSFRNAGIPVLICLGAHDLPSIGPTTSSSDADQFTNLILRRQVIPLDDAVVITSLGGLLGVRGIPFRVVSASPTSLSELRRQPVILVGALDNKWSLRIAETLPYKLERDTPEGQSAVLTGSIIDSKDQRQRWKVDFTVPMSEWHHDYALVARFDDRLTGVPVLLEAGLGNNGSLAANEFLASAELETSLAREPACHGKSSFEAVLETEIVDSKPGPPHAIRVACW